MEVQTTTNRYLKIILIAAIGAYACLLSFAVKQVIDGGVSPRLKIILELGWVFAILACLVLIGWALSKKSASIRGTFDQMAALPFRLKYWLRILIYVVLLLFPIYLSFSGISRGATDSPGFRSILLIPFLLVTSLFFPSLAQSKYSFRLVLTMLFSAYLFLAAGQLVYVVNYPFSLTWSEGNRLYDYSLIFAKSLYPTQDLLTIPYFSPGRFGLWGIWFLIPNLPIWFHRLWNALLWILPPLIFGWICAKGTQPRIIRVRPGSMVSALPLPGSYLCTAADCSYPDRDDRPGRALEARHPDGDCQPLCGSQPLDLVALTRCLGWIDRY